MKIFSCVSVIESMVNVDPKGLVSEEWRLDSVVPSNTTSWRYPPKIVVYPIYTYSYTPIMYNVMIAKCRGFLASAPIGVRMRNIYHNAQHQKLIVVTGSQCHR